jgi:predicted short-subunit dehydrogenase-like oxidoreductase (DUF2520 family)
LASKLKRRPNISTVREASEISSAIVYITVPDDDIAAVVDTIKEKISKRSVVFHTSGSLSSEVLAPLRRTGASVASFHPLASISKPEIGLERFKGAYFCIEGDSKAVRIGKTLARSLGGHPFRIDPPAKALYHAAAVTAAGHAVALFDIAISLMTEAGLSRSESKKVLQPLLAGSVDNLRTQDTAMALTGTFARVDVSTFERHISALKESATDLEMSIYLDLASRSLDLAAKRGADPENISKMRDYIAIAKRDIQC